MNSHSFRIAVVCGNPKPASRTLTVATAVADEVARAAQRKGFATEHLVVDLSALASGMFDPDDKAVEASVRDVRASDVLVAATPVYKASYSGLLKAFIDRFPYQGAAGSVAIPVTLQRLPVHVWAADVHLRPLLVELGALAPTRAVAVVEDELTDLSETVDAWGRDNADLAVTVARTLVREEVAA